MILGIVCRWETPSSRTKQGQIQQDIKNNTYNKYRILLVHLLGCNPRYRKNNHSSSRTGSLKDSLNLSSRLSLRVKALTTTMLTSRFSVLQQIVSPALLHMLKTATFHSPSLSNLLASCPQVRKFHQQTLRTRQLSAAENVVLTQIHSSNSSTTEADGYATSAR